MQHPVIKGEPSEKFIQDYVSQWYDKRYSGSGHQYHSRIVTEMLDGIKFKDGRLSDRVCDVGCGIGFVSSLYPSFDITGVDISDGMLSKNPLKWIKAPAEKMPFPDASFDFVVCRSLLHHLEDPIIGLREMVRVLKPGGRWVCWEPNAAALATGFRKLFQKTDRFSHLHHSFTDMELFRLIQDSGLTIESKRYIGFLAYALCGFPDIIKFPQKRWMTKMLMAIDDWLSKTPLKTMAWSILVKGVKP